MKIERYIYTGDHYQRQAYVRLDKVVKAVGLHDLEKFNNWAFRRHPMIYDDNLTFAWENAHSTKGMNGDTDNVLNIILDLWEKHSKDD